MGTNYYWTEKPPCGHCGRHFEEVHVGKSSGGWAFGLHVDSGIGISTLEDWINRWNLPGSSIRNEYGDAVSADEMLATVTKRSRPDKVKWSAEELQRNYAFVDKATNLLRHDPRLDRNCRGNGDGTFDYIEGEFS